MDAGLPLLPKTKHQVQSRLVPVVGPLGIRRAVASAVLAASAAPQPAVNLAAPWGPRLPAPPELPENHRRAPLQVAAAVVVVAQRSPVAPAVLVERAEPVRS